MTAVLLLLLAGLWLWWTPRSASGRATDPGLLGSWKLRAASDGAQQQELSRDAHVIRELSALLRSGLMFPQALEALLQIRAEPCPVLDALRRLAAKARFRGEQAIEIDHSEGHKDGVDQLAEDLEAELLARQSFDAAMAGPRATTRLLTWLPVVGLGAGFLLGIDVGSTLLTSWPAQLSMAAGAGLWALNRIWCRRLLAATTAQALK